MVSGAKDRGKEAAKVVKKVGKVHGFDRRTIKQAQKQAKKKYTG
jgi:hypothetical protein